VPTSKLDLGQQVAQQKCSTTRMSKFWTWYCYALTTKSRQDTNPRLLQVFGTRPPSRTINLIEIDGLVATYKFVNGQPVLDDRAKNVVYENLQVLESEVSAAIATIAAWKL
jgi:hypothetical protein